MRTAFDPWGKPDDDAEKTLPSRVGRGFQNQPVSPSASYTDSYANPVPAQSVSGIKLRNEN